MHACVRRPYGNQGFSKEFTKILVNSGRTGTQSKYGTYIREWFGFCTRQLIYPMHSNIIEVLEFLHSSKMILSLLMDVRNITMEETCLIIRIEYLLKSSGVGGV